MTFISLSMTNYYKVPNQPCHKVIAQTYQLIKSEDVFPLMDKPLH